MKISTSSLVGATAPITVTLVPGVFTDALATIPENKIGWSDGDQFALVEFLMERLLDPEGNPPAFDGNTKDRIRVVYHPIQEILLRVLIQAFADAGYLLDPTALKAFTNLIGTAEFGKWLSKNNRPDTRKPYITLEKKRGVKNKIFDDLAAGSTPAPPAPAPAAADEGPEPGEPAVEEDATTDVKPAAKPAAKK